MIIRAAAGGLLVLAMAGCTVRGADLTPGPSFVPSAPTAVVPAAAPDVDLSGTLESTDGATAAVRTRLWFGTVTTAPVATKAHPHGWVRLHLEVSGTTTVTNTGDTPNATATAVFYRIEAGYPYRSAVCRRTHIPTDGSDLSPGRCWSQLATPTPFSYAGDTADRLAPGASADAAFGIPSADGIWVDAPADEVAALRQQLARPADVVVRAYPIVGLEPAPALRHTCQAVVTVGSLRPGSCASWPGP